MSDALPFRIRAVVFDMDGLLLDTERVALETFLETAAALRIAATTDLFKTFIGKNWRTTQALLEGALGAADASRMLPAWKDVFRARVERAGVPKKPGVDELLGALEERGMPLALATSTGRDQTGGLLRSAGLLGRFGAIATGDEVANGKPSPEIFLLAAGRLGVDPALCLALEDSEPGVRAASDAGMRVIMVPDLSEPSAETMALTERVCSSLLEVRELLDGIGAG